MPVGFGVTGLVARNGKPVLLDADSPRNVLHRQLLRLEPKQTVARMCLPLPGLEDRIVGVLAAHRSPRTPFGPADLDARGAVRRGARPRLHAEQLWRAVNRHRTERDRLIKQAISAQEAERRRIAFDLHDGVTTALASMSFHLSAADLTVSELAARDLTDSVPLQQEFERARAELVSAANWPTWPTTRREPRSRDCTAWFSTTSVSWRRWSRWRRRRPAATAARRSTCWWTRAAALDDIPDHAAAALYRIAQEALANAVKHADARPDRALVATGRRLDRARLRRRRHGLRPRGTPYRPGRWTPMARNISGSAPSPSAAP